MVPKWLSEMAPAQKHPKTVLHGVLEQGFYFIHGLHGISVELYAIFNLQHIKFRTIAFQAIPSGLDRIDANIAVDKTAAKFTGNCRSDAATAREVGNNHAA